jgi:Mn-dependent DtxR family transcriptional regulator
MKNLFKVAVMATALFAAVQVNAQTVKKDAKKVGHKTSEVAAKGAAAVVDKRYRGKSGPNGENIYINKHSHYYYVNKLGHRVYLKKSQLRDK